MADKTLTYGLLKWWKQKCLILHFHSGFYFQTFLLRSHMQNIIWERLSNPCVSTVNTLMWFLFRLPLLRLHLPSRHPLTTHLYRPFLCLVSQIAALVCKMPLKWLSHQERWRPSSLSSKDRCGMVTNCNRQFGHVNIRAFSSMVMCISEHTVPHRCKSDRSSVCVCVCNNVVELLVSTALSNDYGRLERISGCTLQALHSVEDRCFGSGCLPRGKLLGTTALPMQLYQMC